MGRNFYYVKEAAALLGCTTQAVTKLIHRKELDAGRLGKGRWRITMAEMRRYAKDNNIVLNYPALAEPQGKINAPVQPSPKPYATVEELMDASPG